MKRNTTKVGAERPHKAVRHRQEQAKQELRQAILDTAGALFLEHGYEHFSLRKVAEHIGYSPTTIYLYFRDKDDLLFTVVEEGFIRFRQQLIAAAESQDDPWERLVALGRVYIAFGMQNPMYYQLMFMQRADFLMRSPQGSNQPRIASLQVLEQAMQQALDAGILRPGDAQNYSDVLWALVHGMVSLSISMPSFDTTRLQQTMETAWRIQCQGLRQH